MPPREWKIRIADILGAVLTIQDYVKGLDLAGFCEDNKTVEAVAYNFAVIGEAARNVPEAVIMRHPEVPWQNMKDMRNFMVHVYFGINREIVWKTLRDDLPPLVPC